MKVQYPMYINIQVQWTLHKMDCILKNYMTIIKIKILNDLVHITLLHTINICDE